MSEELRTLPSDRMDELTRLLELVFDLDGEWFRSIITHDPWRELGNTLVALVDGRIVANVQVHFRPLRFGAARLRMGGIGHVATHPDARRRGLAGRLLEGQIAFMRRSGYHLSQLYTSINEYYAKYGWRTIPLSTSRLFLKDWTPSDPIEQYDLAPVSVPLELGRLGPVYDACAAYWLSPLDRTPTYWEASPKWTLGQFLGEDPAACTRAQRGGRLCGYVRGRIANLPLDRASVDELCWLPGDEACLAPLLDAILGAARAVGKEFADLSVGDDHPALAPFAEAGLLASVPDGSVQFRVIDLPGLLTALAPELRARLSAAGIGTQAPLTLDAEVDAARLDLSANEAGAAHSGQADLTLSEESFLRLLLGRATASELSAEGALAWHGTDRTEDLGALFPRRPYWYCRYDKF